MLFAPTQIPSPMTTRKPPVSPEHGSVATTPSRSRVPRVVRLPWREDVRKPTRADRAEHQMRLRRLSAGQG
jgi:hypothetical protein